MTSIEDRAELSSSKRGLFSLYGLLVFFCAGLFVLSITFLVWQNLNQAKSQFNRFGFQVNDSLHHAFVINETILDGFAAYLADVGVKEPQRAHSYTQSMLQRYPNLYMFQAAQHVRLPQIKDFERQLSKQVDQTVTVRRYMYGRGLVAAKQTGLEDFYPLVFVEPETGSAFDMLGLDIASFPFVYGAIEQSALSGLASLSESFELIEGKHAFVMIKPSTLRSERSQGQFALLLVKSQALLQGITLREPGLTLTVRYGNLEPILSETSDKLSEWERQLFPQLSYQTRFALGQGGIHIEVTQQLGLSVLNLPLLVLLLLANVLISFMLHKFLRHHYLSEVEKQRANSLLYQRANYDRLTGLANRHFFEDYVGRALAGCQRRAEKLAVLYLDLNDFKQINDKFGHDMGDRVLTLASAIILDCVRMDDMTSRFGGDEFVVLLEHVVHQEDAKKVMWRIHEEMAKVEFVDKKTISISASIGFAMFPDDGQTMQDLLRVADNKMYAAKRQAKVLSMAEFNKQKI